MKKQGICRKRQEFISTVKYVVDESNYDMIKFFIDNIEDDLRNVFTQPNPDLVKLEVGDFISITENNKILIHSKKRELKHDNLSTFPNVSILKESKEGYFFETFVWDWDADEYKFSILPKKEIEILKKFINLEIFETEKKIYLVERLNEPKSNKILDAEVILNMFYRKLYSEENFKNRFSEVKGKEI